MNAEACVRVTRVPLARNARYALIRRDAATPFRLPL